MQNPGDKISENILHINDGSVLPGSSNSGQNVSCETLGLGDILNRVVAEKHNALQTALQKPDGGLIPVSSMMQDFEASMKSENLWPVEKRQIFCSLTGQPWGRVTEEYVQKVLQNIQLDTLAFTIEESLPKDVKPAEAEIDSLQSNDLIVKRTVRHNLLVRLKLKLYHLEQNQATVNTIPAWNSYESARKKLQNEINEIERQNFAPTHAIAKHYFQSPRQKPTVLDSYINELILFSGPCALWQNQSPENLRRNLKTDPFGYFVYMLHYVLRLELQAKSHDVLLAVRKAKVELFAGLTKDKAAYQDTIERINELFTILSGDGRLPMREQMPSMDMADYTDKKVMKSLIALLSKRVLSRKANSSAPWEQAKRAKNLTHHQVALGSLGAEHLNDKQQRFALQSLSIILLDTLKGKQSQMPWDIRQTQERVKALTRVQTIVEREAAGGIVNKTAKAGVSTGKIVLQIGGKK